MANVVPAYTNDRGEVSLRDPDGTYRWVLKADAQAAVDAGYTPETRDAYEARKAAERADSPLEAGIVAGVSGATLGLSDWVAKQAGLAPHLRELRKANPTASTIGEVTGTIAGALVPGGAVARAGRAAEGLAGRALAHTAERSLARRGATAALRGAAEGGVIGAGQSVGAQSRSGKDIDLGKVALDAAHTALLSGGLSLAGVGLAAAARRGAGVAKAAVGKAAARAKSAVGGDLDAQIAARDILRKDAEALARIEASSPEGVSVADQMRRVAELEDIHAAKIAARKAAGQVARRGVKGYASPLEVARLRVIARDARLPANLRTEIEGKIAKGLTTGQARSLHNLIGARSPKSIMADMPKGSYQTIDGKIVYNEGIRGVVKDLRHVRKAIGDTRLPEALRADAATVLSDAANVASSKAAKTAYKQRVLAIKGAIDDAHGLSAMAEESSLAGVGMRQAARGAREAASSDVKSAAAELEAERAKLQAMTGGWKPASGVAPQDIAKKLEEADAAIATAREARAAAIASGLNKLRAAMGVGGFALGGSSMLMGLGGYALGHAVRYLPRLSGAARAASDAVMSSAPALAAPARLAVVASLGPSDVDDMAKRFKGEDPGRLADETRRGVVAGGGSPQDAETLAAFQAARLAMLREEVAKAQLGGPAARQRLAEIVAAASNPASIVARIKHSNMTAGDIAVLQRLLPKQWASLQAEAAAVMADKPSWNRLSSRQRAFWLRIARPAQRQATYAALASARASGKTKGGHPRPTRASLKMPNMRTPLQRIAATTSHS